MSNKWNCFVSFLVLLFATFVLVAVAIGADKRLSQQRQQAPQITAECPPGLAEQAAAKDAVQVKAQADFAALKREAK